MALNLPAERPFALNLPAPPGQSSICMIRYSLLAGEVALIAAVTIWLGNALMIKDRAKATSKARAATVASIVAATMWCTIARAVKEKVTYSIAKAEEDLTSAANGGKGGVFWPIDLYDKAYKNKKKPPIKEKTTVDGIRGYMLDSSHGCIDGCGYAKRRASSGVHKIEPVFQQLEGGGSAHDFYEAATKR